ncbi:MAG TPA: hypothetical protein VEL47_03380 [Myxococcota bacterium]|nr:hypothetical protein [Myxococcota bacterium]
MLKVILVLWGIFGSAGLLAKEFTQCSDAKQTINFRIDDKKTKFIWKEQMSVRMGFVDIELKRSANAWENGDYLLSLTDKKPISFREEMVMQGYTGFLHTITTFTANITISRKDREAIYDDTTEGGDHNPTEISKLVICEEQVLKR